MTNPTLPVAPPAGTIARARTYLDRIDATDAGASLVRLDGAARIRLLCEQANAAANVAAASALVSTARSAELAALIALLDDTVILTAAERDKIAGRVLELAGIEVDA